MSKVFQPLKINNLNLKHRIIIPPMATRTAGNNGEVTEATLKHYQRLTESKLVSLIILEHAYVNRQGKASLRSPQLSLGSNADQVGLKKLINLVLDNDAYFLAQLNHAGSSADVSLDYLKGPSAIVNPKETRLPQALTEQEIKTIIEDFKNSALLAYNLGFNGIEIHGAHGFLVNQFLSPLTNQRNDYYGGSLTNRQNFLLEIIRAIKNELPADFPVFVRLAATDFHPDGISLADTIDTARKLSDLNIAALHISGSFFGYNHPNLTPPGYFKEITSTLKASLKLPIILTGGITSLAEAETLLEKEAADLIGIGRKVLQNPKWIKDNLKRADD